VKYDTYPGGTEALIILFNYVRYFICESKSIGCRFLSAATVAKSNGFQGMDGVKCDHIFEACDGQQAHQCYHGGECIPGLQDKFGNTQLYCPNRINIISSQ
jgi:hypothetical protein